MKESVFDALMYMVQLSNGETQFIEQREEYRHLLDQEGFTELEVDKAFSWLEGLQEVRDCFLSVGTASLGSTRYFDDFECDVLDIESRALLLSLEKKGVLNDITREIIIDRALALGEDEEIDMVRLKWLILLVLYNLPGVESELAWVECWENKASIH